MSLLYSAVPLSKQRSIRVRAATSCYALGRGIPVVLILCLGTGCASILPGPIDFHMRQAYPGERAPQDQIATLIIRDGVNVARLDGRKTDGLSSGPGSIAGFFSYDYYAGVELKPGHYVTALEYLVSIDLNGSYAEGGGVTLAIDVEAAHVYQLKPELSGGGFLRAPDTWRPKFEDITRTMEGAKWLKRAAQCKNREMLNLK